MRKDDDDEMHELNFETDDPDEAIEDHEDDEVAVDLVPEDPPEDLADPDPDPEQDEPDDEPDTRDVQPDPEDPGQDDETAQPALPSSRWVRAADLHLEYKHWVNPRSITGLGDESIAALAASISRGSRSDENGVYAGIEDAIDVVQIATSSGPISLIIDGQRRFLATQKAFGAEVSDVWVPVNDLEPEPVKWTEDLSAKYLARALGKVGTREGLSSFELSENAERLRNSTDPDTGKDYTLAAIAVTIGRSESWVSKILAARDKATPSLMLSWKKGDVTDEQFKELSAIDKRSQKKAASDVVEARKSGDLTGARTLAKERKAIAAAKDKAKESAEPAPERKLKKGEQSDMGLPPPKKAPPFAVVEDMIATSVAHPPTHDYVKGMMDALKWDRGLMDAAEFAKPWKTYMERVADSKTSPAKKRKAKK